MARFKKKEKGIAYRIEFSPHKPNFSMLRLAIPHPLPPSRRVKEVTMKEIFFPLLLVPARLSRVPKSLQIDKQKVSIYTLQTFPEGVDSHGSPRLQTVQLYLVSAGRQQLTLKLQRLQRGVMPVGGSSFHSENTNRGGKGVDSHGSPRLQTVQLYLVSQAGNNLP